MAKNKLDDDLFARKITRYLVIVEIASLFIALILLLFRAFFLALALATLTFFAFVGVFLWLYFRYNTFPDVQEKRNLQKTKSEVQSSIQSETNEINRAIQNRSQLIDNEKREKDLALAELQKQYIQNGMNNTQIDSAKIPGIGPKLKEKLALFGYRTAADVNQKIGTIDGFGESKTQSLLHWKQAIYDGLVKSQPMALPNNVFDNITHKYLSKQQENDTSQSIAEKKKASFRDESNTITSWHKRAFGIR